MRLPFQAVQILVLAPKCRGSCENSSRSGGYPQCVLPRSSYIKPRLREQSKPKACDLTRLILSHFSSKRPLDPTP